MSSNRCLQLAKIHSHNQRSLHNRTDLKQNILLQRLNENGKNNLNLLTLVDSNYVAALRTRNKTIKNRFENILTERRQLIVFEFDCCAVGIIRLEINNKK